MIASVWVTYKSPNCAIPNARVGGSRARLPLRLLGLDFDVGSEFLNAHLVRYSTREALTFTRSRPSWKNDQAHVEQKNWSVVRKLVGYGRYESEAALAQLNRVYELLRVWTNFGSPRSSSPRRSATPRRARAEEVRHRPDAVSSAAGQRRPRRRAGAGPGRNVRRSRPLALRRQLAAAVEQLARLQERPDERVALKNERDDLDGLTAAG